MSWTRCFAYVYLILWKGIMWAIINKIKAAEWSYICFKNRYEKINSALVWRRIETVT